MADQPGTKYTLPAIVIVGNGGNVEGSSEGPEIKERLFKTCQSFVMSPVSMFQYREFIESLR